MSSILKDKYKKEIIPRLKETFVYKNDLAVPRVEKVVVSVGLGDIIKSKKRGALEKAVENLMLVTGQKPVFTRAKKAISNFNIRKNDVVGMLVTLRKDRMYDFLYRLANIVLPRVRDFQGIRLSSFDGQGNVSIGLKEHAVFLEVESDDVEKVFGMQVTIRTSARDNKEGLKLIKLLGFPIRKGARS